MNLYFIVEGRRTEKKVYPIWLSYLIPDLKRVQWAKDIEKNNYFLFNGNGYPALLHTHLKNSIEEVNDLRHFNYLVLVMDVDELTIEERINEVETFLKENNLKLDAAELVIIPQNKCIETWFLGNQKIYKSNPQNSDLLDFMRFYNVRDNDPEKMGHLPSFGTHSQFHFEYCYNFLRERNIKYTKNHPQGVIEKDYLDALIKRNEQTSHLESFKIFLDFCERVRQEMS